YCCPRRPPERTKRGGGPTDSDSPIPEGSGCSWFDPRPAAKSPLVLTGAFALTRSRSLSRLARIAFAAKKLPRAPQKWMFPGLASAGGRTRRRRRARNVHAEGE